MNRSKIVVVACEGPEGLESLVSGHFGHTPYFVVVEIADGKIGTTRVVASPGHGKGCSLPVFVQSMGANAVIVGGIGAGAMNSLSMRKIAVTAGVAGKVGDVLKSYAAGTLIGGKPGCHGHDHDHDHDHGHGHGHTCGHYN